MSYANTPLILPMKDAEAAFIDYSRHGRVIRVYGNATQNTDVPMQYSTSFDHDGNTSTMLQVDGINLSSGVSSAATGARDFTIDFRITPGASGTELLFFSLGSPGSGTGANAAQRQGFAITRETDNKIRIRGGNLNTDGAGGYYDHDSTSAVTTETHVRVVVASNAVHLFLDGTEDTLVNNNGSWQTSLANAKLFVDVPLNIGRSNVVYTLLGGGSSSAPSSAAYSMDDLRVVYESLGTGAFTPPTLFGTLSNQGAGGEPVKDDAGTAAVRTMIAVPRIYGALDQNRAYQIVSDGSGNFSLSVPASAEFSDIDGYSVIALDDSAGTDYNDLVFGRVETV